MISDSDQILRHWLDQVLQITTDGLKKPVLAEYKNKYPHNYMAEIRAKLDSSDLATGH